MSTATAAAAVAALLFMGLNAIASHEPAMRPPLPARQWRLGRRILFTFYQEVNGRDGISPIFSTDIQGMGMDHGSTKPMPAKQMAGSAFIVMSSYQAEKLNR